jgi:hypothetical protein
MSNPNSEKYPSIVFFRILVSVTRALKKKLNKKSLVGEIFFRPALEPDSHLSARPIGQKTASAMSSFVFSFLK